MKNKIWLNIKDRLKIELNNKIYNRVFYIEKYVILLDNKVIATCNNLKNIKKEVLSNVIFNLN